MGRVERKKMEQRNKLKKIKRLCVGSLTAVFLISFLYLGLFVVDKTNRALILWEKSNLIRYKQLDINDYEVVFCGDTYIIDTEKASDFLFTFKKKMKYGQENIKTFIEEKSQIISRIIYDHLKN